MSDSTALEWFKSSYSDDEGQACLEVAYDWRKSSYSTEQGGACLEVSYPWLKSSYSGDEGGECLEMAAEPTTIHIRDSKDPGRGHLTLTPATWTAFLALPQRRP
ncbi:DUF397 domain-containing protein [Streptomyces spectabilis]|uniref:DUF397 domain-containing protein n=1 Tax=Streptomyces spectabilis TaxID=68270 RepID=UPI0033C791EA